MSSRRHILPGFGLSLGFTLFYLGVLVLVPLGALTLKSSELGWTGFWEKVLNPRALAAYRLTLGASFAAAAINVVFGVLLAWVLVRYRFFGRRIVDAMVDLPFALPTAVGGLTLGSLYAPNGWLGQFLVPLGIHGVNTRLAIVIALTFVSLPFVVRTVQPVLETLDHEVEEAAALLGAGRWRTFRSILLPALFPAVLTGFALAFARSVGEFGSILFVSSHKPFETEIAPLLITIRLDEYDYPGAIAMAVFLLLVSFVILGAINLLEAWTRRSQQA
jgi:sulfate transport system permease protein